MRKILCATDFSDGGHLALHAASRFAIDHDCELVIVHAWYLPALAVTIEASFPVETLRRLVADGHARLARAAREASEAGVARVSTKFVEGPPADRIVEVAREDRAIDLIVLGTHGRTGFPRVVLGSVAERVVRHAPCSTLAVRSDVGRFSRLLCAIDFSEQSRDAVSLARTVAEKRESEVVLLHVVDLPSSYLGNLELAGYFATLDTLCTQMLEVSARILREKQVKTTTRVEVGNPLARVLAVLEEDHPFDLVIVGSHGHTGLRRAFLGSVAERIVRHASCSVLVARPRD